MRMRGLCLVEMVAVSIAFAACVAGNSTPRIFDERLVKMGVHVRARPPGLLGIVHAMRLRGGSKKALEMVTTDYKTSPRELEVGIREDTGILGDQHWAARGMADVLPIKVTEIQSRKEANAMTADDIFLDNAMTVQSKEHGERRKGQALRKLRKSLENDLLDLREAQDAGDPDAEAAIIEAEKRIDGLTVIEKELKLARRYSKKDAVFTDEEGEEYAVVKKHSPWVDMLDSKLMDDVAEWELGLREDKVGLSRYATPWSSVFKASTMDLESNRRVTHNERFRLDDFTGTARARDPLPRSGVHYFEILVTSHGGQRGDSLGGGAYVGLVDGNVTDWDGNWEMEGHLPPNAELVAGIRNIDRRKHIMALHDACCRPRGEVTWAGGLRKAWVNGSSFGHGDRVGFMVNMDTRTVRVYKNGAFMGRAWGDLPDEVYPMVTLVHPGSSAELCFPRIDDDLAKEQRQSQLYLEHMASLPPPAPGLPPPEEMILDVAKYREPLIHIFKKQRDRHKRKVKGQTWNILTAFDYIRMHKCNYALWGFGLRKSPPVTRFVNEVGTRLVFRGDGTIPPRTEEEDEAMIKEGLLTAEGTLVAVDGKGGAAAGGGDAQEVKKKKTSLPWKLYRKEQKRLKKEIRLPISEDQKEESKRIKRLRDMDRPTDPVLPIPENLGKRLQINDLGYYGLDKPRAVNNARRAAKIVKRMRGKKRRDDSSLKRR